jgi:glycosyltransferase involved in cell wall biosynthesis
MPNQMVKKKLKVVWLCYFTNQFVQDNLKPFKRIGEIAPWISNMIPLFENDDSIDLHIVSQHRWIGWNKCFKNKGVTYHFFNAGIPLIGRHWPGFFRIDIWTNFFATKLHIARIVHKIQPDIIHLHGTENEFCSSIFQFYKIYPILITIQGFIHKSTAKSKIVKKLILDELRIIKMFYHYGYRTKTMGDELKIINRHAQLHWHQYPMPTIDPIKVDKQYDLVFFARVSKEKGIEDLLHAVVIIKKEKPDISLCVIGGGKLDHWKEKANELHISNNIFWAGFLPTQKDVHKMASTAKISVLPTYNDIISGTIIESLFLNLPVVAYNVGSIHEINKFEDIITLVEKFNILELAESILKLLNDMTLREEIAKKGYKRVKEMFNSSFDVLKSELLEVYSSIIKEFTLESI